MNTVSDKNQQIGSLYVQSPQGEQLVFPLKHTEVLAKIAGNLSRVEVIQSFENPFTQPLEAVYIFPLPDEAAVDDMEIKIGDAFGNPSGVHSIKGNIKKRTCRSSYRNGLNLSTAFSIHHFCCCQR